MFARYPVSVSFLKRIGVTLGLALGLTCPAAGTDRAAAPADSRTVVATVLSHPIYAHQIEPSSQELREHEGADSIEQLREQLRGRHMEARIVGPLQRRFCAQHGGCEATEAEIRAMLDTGGAGREHAVRQDVARVERKVIRDGIRDFIGGWKFHRALYQQYGGEVIWQVLGPNAVGAYRRWLEEEEAHGHFRIETPELRAAFFKAVSGYGGRGIPSGEDPFAHPPWSEPAR